MKKKIRLIPAWAFGMLLIPTLATAATTIRVIDPANLAAKGAGVYVSSAAAREILDRAYGRPSQSHTIEGNVSHSFQVLTHAELFEGDEITIAPLVTPLLERTEPDHE